MAKYSILISVLFILPFSYASSVVTVNGRIKLTIGTTAGDTYTANFVRNHLVPTYQQFKDKLDVEFVPWGNTERHLNGTMTCEFGEYDCWANRMHRCVLNHLRSNVKAQVDYMACEFTEPFPAFEIGSYRCASAAGMRIVNADWCVNNPSRDNLDDEAETAAALPMATIGSVPFVIFNDNTIAEDSAEAQRRLLSMVCFALANDPNSGVVSCQI